MTVSRISRLTGRLVLLLLVLAFVYDAEPVSAQPITMTIAADSPESKHDNFRIQAAGFSVSYVPNKYQVYGTAGYDLWMWKDSNYKDWISFYNTSYPFFASAQGEDCSHAKDPRVWARKCSSDAIGYFWKRVGCPLATVACQDNDRWNASPGTYNLTTFAHPSVWPKPPKENPSESDFGTKGYVPIIDAAKINSVPIQPADTSCQATGDTIWMDDTLPSGAVGSGTDSWKWAAPNPSPTPYPSNPDPTVTPNPSPSPVVAANPEFPPPPFPSWLSHQSANTAGIHQQIFDRSLHKLHIKTGDKLIAYIYINANSIPRQVMLQWHESASETLPQGSWNHRAIWSSVSDASNYNLIPWGNLGTAGRRYMGSVPEAKKWVRLEVPAALIGLEGKSIDGMAFTLYDGQATWDHAGKTSPLSGNVVNCPPKTWLSGAPEKSFHAYNPDDFATGAANSKVIQVKYTDNTTRWFMVFNKMIKYMSTTYGVPWKFNQSNFGGSAADNWQVMWATSPDGANWTIHPQMLFRSSGETQREHLGALVVDIITDNGYFYVLFQDLMKPHLYMARAPIDTVNSTNSPGYVQNVSQGWRIASYPIQPNGEYTWKSFSLGVGSSRVDLQACKLEYSIVSPK